MLTLVGLGLFALVAVVMSYFDVREHIASQKAATMVKAAAKVRLSAFVFRSMQLCFSVSWSSCEVCCCQT